MKDLPLKTTILGIMLLIILSGFNTSISKNGEIITSDNRYSTLFGENYLPKDETSSKYVSLVRHDNELLMDKIFPEGRSFGKTHSELIEFVPGEFIVKFKSDVNVKVTTSKQGIAKTDISSVDTLNKKHMVKNINDVFEGRKKTFDNSFDFSNVYKFTLSEERDVLSVIEDFKNDPNIEYAEPNYIFYNYTIPNDPFFDEQWALSQLNDCDIDAPEAWDIQTGDNNVTIAVIDTGVDYTNPDLADNIWINDDEIPDNGIDDDNNGYIDDIKGYDFCTYRIEQGRDSDPMDDNGHGTHCSGIASAVTNNSVGIAGVTWNCKIMPVKFLNSYGQGSFVDAVDAIIYAAENDADVISMSWGGSMGSELVEDALEYAHNLGVVLVAAAGNSNSSSKSYPAGYDCVIAVAATDNNDEKASFSNYGNWVDVAAPGVNIYSTVLNNDYENHSGTSMACPHVSGLAGLLFSKNQSLTANMVKTIICSSVDAIESTYYIGSGRINAYEALQRKPALAILDSFKDWTNVKGVINITGLAWGAVFQYYLVEYGKGREPETWVEITNSTTPINETDVLASLNTTELDEGIHIIRLKVVCSDGIYEDTTLIVVNNEFNLFIVDDDGGPDADYIKINDAIDDSGTRDEIYVRNGTYNQGLFSEDIKVDRSIKLTGESSTDTIIGGSMILVADDITFSRFMMDSWWSLYPVLLWFNKNNVVNEINIKSISAGIYLYKSNNNVISNNIIKSDDKIFDGITLASSSNNVISDNHISNSYYGIDIFYGSNNTIIYNTINKSRFYGISLAGSGRNSLQGNYLVDCGLVVSGLNLSAYVNDVDTSNLVNDKPIYYYVNKNGLSVPSDAGEVILVNCSNCIISDLAINGSSVGVELAYSTNNIIIDNTFSNNHLGVYAVYSNNSNFISGNNIYNTDFSISMIYSCNNIMSGNTISNSSVAGIYLGGCSNIISENVIRKSEFGINLVLSKNSMIYGNIIDDNEIGIDLSLSNNIVLRDNHMSNCSLRLRSGNNYIYSVDLYDFIHDIDISNTVNGKQVYYYVNQTGISVPSDAGEVILVNCNNCNVSNLMINNCTLALELAFSDSNTICNNSLCDVELISSNNNKIQKNHISGCKYYGIILLYGSNNNILNGNTISDNFCIPSHNYRGISILNSDNNIIEKNDVINLEGFKIEEDLPGGGHSILVVPAFGICLEENSHNNTLSGNTISNNLYTYGVMIWYYSSYNNITSNIICNNQDWPSKGLIIRYNCNDNIICKNNISNNNKTGIEIRDSSNNNIYHNIFINNHERNAVDSGSNSWDDGYPSGGNYWSDYQGTDDDGDGIGDIPYDIFGGNNQDRYPLGYFKEKQPPQVKITKPVKGLYFMNLRIRRFLIRRPLIIGRINIEVDASDEESGLDRVEFYIDNKLIENDTVAPYTYLWKKAKGIRFRHTIKVVAFDKDGNSNSDEIKVRKFF